jgi:hypothetical protein
MEEGQKERKRLGRRERWGKKGGKEGERQRDIIRIQNGKWYITTYPTENFKIIKEYSKQFTKIS